MRNGIASLLGILCLAPGCYSTVYTNFAPRTDVPVHHTGSEESDERYWRHFWAYGWAPLELIIFADRACGGVEHIERIETQQSFVQGLIAAFAGYYVNIYSPYSARVVCDHSVPAAPY